MTGSGAQKRRQGCRSPQSQSGDNRQKRRSNARDSANKNAVNVPQKERSRRQGTKFTSLQALQEREGETDNGQDASLPLDDAQRPSDEPLAPDTQDQGRSDEELPTNRGLFPTVETYTPPAEITPDLVLPEGTSEAEAEKVRQAYALLQSLKVLPDVSQRAVTVSNHSDRPAPSAGSARGPVAGGVPDPKPSRPRSQGLMWDVPDAGDATPDPAPRGTSTASVVAATQGSTQHEASTPQSTPAAPPTRPLDILRMEALPLPSNLQWVSISGTDTAV